MSVLARMMVAATAPASRIDVRCRHVERALGLPMTGADIRSVRQVAGKTPIGAYYHWYLQKLLISRVMRNLHRERALALIRDMDQTDYMAIQSVVDSPTGVIIAIPHHAHYVPSMIALARRISCHRRVKVFYGQIAKNAGNAIFDQMHELLFSSATDAVDVIHDNRHGLAQAIVGLNGGEVVLIMPDAFQDEGATVMIPFCGRLMNAMLGTAALARRTGSWILPAISRLHGNRLAFRTHFGTRIDHPLQGSRASARQTRVRDYAVTRDMFKQFEIVMQGELYLWQHVRGHLAGNVDAHLADMETLPTMLAAIEAASPFRAPDLVLDLQRTPPAHIQCVGYAGDVDRSILR
jgi:lauroyl/myristoyl acyltransferase